MDLVAVKVEVDQDDPETECVDDTDCRKSPRSSNRLKRPSYRLNDSDAEPEGPVDADWNPSGRLWSTKRLRQTPKRQTGGVGPKIQRDTRLCFICEVQSWRSYDVRKSFPARRSDTLAKIETLCGAETAQTVREAVDAFVCRSCLLSISKAHELISSIQNNAGNLQKGMHIARNGPGYIPSDFPNSQEKKLIYTFELCDDD